MSQQKIASPKHPSAQPTNRPLNWSSRKLLALLAAMTDADKVFSIEGRGLKLDTAADLEAHIADLRARDVEEVRLLGNTLGVEACRLLGEVLATKKNLKASTHRKAHAVVLALLTSPSPLRLPTWPISSPVDSWRRSPRACPPFSRLFSTCPT